MKEVCSEVMAERQLLGIVVLEFAFLPSEDVPAGSGRIEVSASSSSFAEPIGEHLLVAMYAWDGNAYPGNEWWGGLECQFAHVTRQNLREMASSATIARREAFQKASLHTSFGFARLCNQEFSHTHLTSPHPTSPHPAPPLPMPLLLPHHKPHSTHRTTTHRQKIQKHNTQLKLCRFFHYVLLGSFLSNAVEVVQSSHSTFQDAKFCQNVDV